MKIEVIRSNYNDIIWLKQAIKHSSSGNESGENTESKGEEKIEITQDEK